MTKQWKPLYQKGCHFESIYDATQYLQLKSSLYDHNLFSSWSIKSILLDAKVVNENNLKINNKKPNFMMQTAENFLRDGKAVLRSCSNTDGVILSAGFHEDFHR